MQTLTWKTDISGRLHDLNIGSMRWRSYLLLYTIILYYIINVCGKWQGSLSHEWELVDERGVSFLEGESALLSNLISLISKQVYLDESLKSGRYISSSWVHMPPPPLPLPIADSVKYLTRVCLLCQAVFLFWSGWNEAVFRCKCSHPDLWLSFATNKGDSDARRYRSGQKGPRLRQMG